MAYRRKSRNAAPRRAQNRRRFRRATARRGVQRFSTRQRRAQVTRYNPTWNPQFMKIKRKIDYLVPPADLNRGTFGVYPYLFVAAGTLDFTSSPQVGAYNYTSKYYNFNLKDIPSILEFGSIFDQYKITGIKLTFQYLNPEANLTNTMVNGTYACEMAIVNDYDADSAPTANDANWAKLQETGRARFYRFPSRSNKLSYFIRPKTVQTSLKDSNGTYTAVANGPSLWIDGNTTYEALYNGIYVMIRAHPSSAFQGNHIFSATATYYCKFRQRH